MGSARSSGPDARLAVVMRAQHGAFTGRQALDAGFSPSMVKRRVAGGRWLRLHRGVFCESVMTANFERDTSAAVLACGSGAAASHRTAARLWDLEAPAPERPEVTVPAPGRKRPPGVLVHVTARLTRAESAVHRGIRVTTPARTLVDLASVVEPKILELGLDAAWRRRLVSPARLATYLDADWCRSRSGTAALRRLVSERLGQGPNGSDLETRMLQLVRRSGLPSPVRQHPVVTPFGVRYLDLAYPDRKIAIELDGMATHMDRQVFLDDRVRQNLIEAQGWTFRRFGYAHVRKDVLWTIFTLAEALGLRPVRWRSATPRRSRT